MENIQDKLTEGLKNGDQKVFNSIFEAYYAPLCRYCTQIVYDPDVAEEIVQDLFCKIWIKREELEITTSLKAYLYKAVLNHSVNHLNYTKLEDKYREYVGFSLNEGPDSPIDLLGEEDIKRILSLAVMKMPEKRRMIFEMSRKEELKYSEIAEKLNISQKTVEAQISKALDYLRKVFFEMTGVLLPIFLSSKVVDNEVIMSGIQAIV